jgi:creatinine amidohydrolase
MVLAHMTWPEVEASSRESVVLIPTGSLEQHGPHLPLFTDSLLATHVASAVERAIPDKVLMTPTLWLGASGHHLAFAGTLSADFDVYMGAISSVVRSLRRHGFYKFYLLNGHGGNNEPNGMVLRKLKEADPELQVGHSGYYAFGAESSKALMTGPLKEIKHACEAEASMMLHVHPDLVRRDKLRDDGLVAEPAIRGMVHLFDEITQQGSFGFATRAEASKGERMINAAIEGIVRDLTALADGHALGSIVPSGS